ncbi:MAG: hypothetical protein KJI71_04095 [Patescibacteria group bacterium]|nr:hypothetical protein [Patescibacteria group bacterium]
MAIKNRRKVIILILFTFSLFFFGSFNVLSKPSIQKNYDPPKISGPDLPDKVYLFQSPQDSLMLNDIVLEQYYVYYLYVEIVTPYNCSIKITLWDPESKQFNIFESDLLVEPEGANYFEIPFGTALAGDYDIKVEVITPGNVNVYIKMEKGSKCLYDKIPMEEVDDIKLYQVTRFSNEMNINHSVLFTTDYMYKFYVGRVSPISVMENNEVRLDFIIKDPNGIIYPIFLNATLAEIDDIERFKFGTAIGGLYTFDVIIYSSVGYVNIGYSIIQLYQISVGPEINQTKPTNSSTVINRYFTMPIGWTIGILGFFGTISVIIAVILYKQKNKNVISSNF